MPPGLAPAFSIYSVDMLALGYLLPLVCALSGFAQQFEAGADIGYGFYRSGSIYSADGTAQAGIGNRFAAGIFLADEFANYVSAEFDYLYHDGHPFLRTPNVRTDIQGNSDALTIELLFHFKPRGRRFRPFLGGGSGAKEYVIAGPAADPADRKFLLRPHMMLRAEFRDYLTTFPKQEIVPAPHNTARGIFEQFTPLFGISYTF